MAVKKKTASSGSEKKQVAKKTPTSVPKPAAKTNKMQAIEVFRRLE